MKTKNTHTRFLAAMLMAMFLLTWAVPGYALNLGGLTQSMGPQLAQMVADKLGIKVPVDQIMGLLDQGKAVSGEVVDPAKLTDLGIAKADKGDLFKLINQGSDKLSIIPDAGGDGITQKISQLFGPLASAFK